MSTSASVGDTPAVAPHMQDITAITLLDGNRNETDIKTSFLLLDDRSKTFQSIKFQAEFYGGKPEEFRALHVPIDMPEMHILGDGQELQTKGTIYHIVTAVPTEFHDWGRLSQQEATLRFVKGTPTQWDGEWPNRTQLLVSEATLNESQQPTWDLSSRSASGYIDSVPATITETVRLVLEDPQFPQDPVPEDAEPENVEPEASGQEGNTIQGAPETSDEESVYSDAREEVASDDESIVDAPAPRPPRATTSEDDFDWNDGESLDIDSDSESGRESAT